MLLIAKGIITSVKYQDYIKQMEIVFQDKVSTSHSPLKQAVPRGPLMSFADIIAEPLSKERIRRAEVDMCGEEGSLW